MSDLTSLVLSAAQVAALNQAFIRPQRSIGGVVAYVTLKETHEDEVTITEHPLEKGSVVADHAIKQPAQLTIECGWSNSPPITGISLSGTPPQLSVQEVYQELLRMQSDVELVDVLTGKRTYNNMAITRLATITDKNTENALLISITLRQLLFVGTRTLTLQPSSDAAASQFPGTTLPTVESGTRQLGPAPLFKGPPTL